MDISRREILKLLSLSPLGYYFLDRLEKLRHASDQQSANNVLLIVFDAWTANNIPLYGYPRDTMPNLSRLAERATIYHQHFAGGPFTTPGTSSLLTGTYPWTNRGFQNYGSVIKEFEQKNIFTLLPGHHKVAYTQNPLADIILNQFSGDINDFVPILTFYLGRDFASRLFGNDFETAGLTERQLLYTNNGISYSLLLSHLLYLLAKRENQKVITAYEDTFPLGLPVRSETNFYNLEKPLDWLQSQFSEFPNPYFCYFHLLPPHGPYNTRIDFYNKFKSDEYQPIDKPNHLFQKGQTKGEMNEARRLYDEFLLYVDAEFARLFEFMDRNDLF